MRVHSWLMIVLLATCLGIGIGYTLASGNSGAAPAAPIAGQVAETPRTGAPLPEAAGANRPVDQSDPEAEAASETDPLIATLKQWGASELDPVAGSITARVLDLQGRPLAGVRVELYPLILRGVTNPYLNVWLPEDEYWRSVSDNFLGTARYAILARSYAQAAESSDQGLVVFTSLVDVPYNMHAQHADGVLEAETRTIELEPGAEITWVMRELGGASVTIDAPADAGAVKVTASGGPAHSEQSALQSAPGEAVTFRLKAGIWHIRASDKGGRHVSEPVTIEVKSDGHLQPVTLALKPIARIQVLVKFKGGRPQSSAHAEIAPARGDLSEAGHFDSRRKLATPLIPSYSHSDGNWTSDFAPGEYLIRVALAGSEAVVRRVNAPAGLSTVEVEFEAPPESAGIVCVMELPSQTASAGQPRFQPVATNGDMDWRTRISQVWVLSAGRYLLLGAKSAASIRVSYDSLGSLTQKVTGSVLLFRFVAPAKVTVVLEGCPENPLWRPSARLLWLDDPSVEPKVVENSHDRVVFSGQPGRVEACIYDSTFRTMVLASQTLNLREGESREITLRLPQMFELVLEGSQGELRNVSLSPQDDDTLPLSLYFGSDGRCIVPLLPAGSYTLKFTTRSQPSKIQEKIIKLSSNSTVAVK